MQPIKADTRKSTSLLKKHLKALFGIDCRVKSEFYSMGCSLNVYYELGPDEDEIEKEVKKLQYGGFDGMTDSSYTIDNAGIIVDGYELESFKHVFVKQEIPATLQYRLAQFISDNLPMSDIPRIHSEEDYKNSRFENFTWNAWNWQQLFYQLFQVKNFATQDESKIEIKSVDFSDKHNGRVFFTYEVEGVTYSTDEVPVIAAKQAPNFAPVEVPAGTIQVIDYSEKAIAVIGDTKPIKEKLKELGGKFNFRLSCGAGWIFPKSKLEALKAALAA